MSAPANLEFDFIESPPPDYNTIQIIHHLNTAPPPYDACVRSTCAQSSKFRWSSGFRDSYCIRIATIATTACGFLMLLSAVLLLALQQILPDRLALLGWCLFGKSHCYSIAISIPCPPNDLVALSSLPHFRCSSKCVTSLVRLPSKRRVARLFFIKTLLPNNR